MSVIKKIRDVSNRYSQMYGKPLPDIWLTKNEIETLKKELTEMSGQRITKIQIFEGTNIHKKPDNWRPDSD